MDRLLKIEEVAVLIGSSVKTINTWYAWKRENPDHELAKLLPEYTQTGERQLRLWKQEDIYALLEFKSKIPQGRNGIMGSVTQKYYKKGDTNEKN